jgi:hypothetical protein
MLIAASFAQGIVGTAATDARATANTHSQPTKEMPQDGPGCKMRESRFRQQFI